MPESYYILMADIVNSGGQNAVSLMEDFKYLVNLVNTAYRELILSPLTITLGDEFQGVLHSLKNAVEVIVAMEECIVSENMGFKLRYVLNYGEIETPINLERSYGMLGNGLTTARELLGELKEDKDKRFLIKMEENQLLVKQLNLAFLQYQYFVDEWKAKDYNIITEFLLNKDYKEVAQLFDKNPSSMWRKKRSLNIEVYLSSKELVSLLCPKQQRI